MTVPILIGLTGPAGCGKTTAANYLESEWGAQPVGLADPIMAMLLALFAEADVPDAYAVERALKERCTSLGYSYRHLAQTLGTEWGRDQLDDGFWRRIAEGKVLDIMRGGDHAVVTDIRFADEAQWLRDLGGVLVRITRAGTLPVREHESEAQWAQIEVDHELANEGSVAALHDLLDWIMTRELGRSAA